jgi:hypothetical protein
LFILTKRIAIWKEITMQVEGHLSSVTDYVETGEDAILQWKLALDQGRYLSYLNSLELRAMSDGDVVSLLSSLLLELYERQDALTYDDKVLEDLLTTFDLLRPPFTRSTPIEVVFVVLPGIDLTALSWLWMRRNVDLLTVLIDLITWLPNEQAYIVLPKVLSIYLRSDLERPYELLDNPSREGGLSNLLPNDTIAYLMDVATEKGNDGMWSMLRDAYSEDAPLVAPGPWMLDARPIEILEPVRPYLVGERLNEQIKSILEQTIPKESLLEAETVIWADTGICDATTRIQVYGISDDRYDGDEVELFRQYGPSNTFILDSPDEDLPRGADRMLLCDLYNWDEEEDIPIPIYTGVCDWKGHRISSERAALRMPVLGGGWTGSYCSALCVRERLEDMRETEMPSREVDATLAMVDSMMQQLLQWGIYSELTPEREAL